MPTEPLDQRATTHRLQELTKAGHLDAKALERSLTLAGIIPSQKSWQTFINRTLLFLGAAFVLAGIIFFFAYNWARMGRFLKVGLIEIGIVIAVSLAWRRGLEQLSGKVLLLIAAVLVGPLFGVYGQVYQTGADPYELFALWAVLIAGWVAISRFSPLWFIWLILLNIGLILYWFQVLDLEIWTFGGLCEAAFLLNVGALAVWEVFAARKIPWLTGRWIPRIIHLAAVIFLVIPTVMVIFIDDSDVFLSLAPLLYIGGFGFCLWFYQLKIRDLFILAICLFSGIAILTSLFMKILGWEPGVFIVYGLLVIGQSVAAVMWLRRIEKQWSDAE